MKTYRIANPLYGGRVTLVLGSDDELREWLANEHTGRDWEDLDGMFFTDRERGRLTHYILVSTRTEAERRLSTLAHEVLHLTFAVMRSAEVIFSEDSEEAFTYYFGAMFESCAKHLK